jgi:Tfp pilus assembly protein PilZ
LNDQPRDNPQQCPGLILGTVLRMQIEGLGAILTNLIGMEDGSYLIIKTPPMPEIGSKLFQKNHIIIRYLYAGQVFGFRTTLLGLIKEPFRFSILSYPTNVEKVNIRKHERVCCMLPAELKIPQGLYAILIEDISLGGCFFEVNVSKDRVFPSIRIGDEVLMILSLPEMPDSIILNIIVRTIKCDVRSMKIGVKFKESGHESALQDIYNHIIKDPNFKAAVFNP